MRGKILSGLGQAQYFLTREGYSRQFAAKLGFVPFPGTLNVLLEEPFPAEGTAIEIKSFTQKMTAPLGHAVAIASCSAASQPQRSGARGAGTRRS